MRHKPTLFRCANCGTRRSIVDARDIDHPINCKKCGYNLRGSAWNREGM